MGDGVPFRTVWPIDRLPLTLQELITALDKAQPSDEIDVKYSTLLALTKGCDDVLFIQRLARSCFGR